MEERDLTEVGGQPCFAKKFSYPLLDVSLSNSLVLADCTFLPLLQGFHLDTNGTLLILILGLDKEAIGKSLLWVTL